MSHAGNTIVQERVADRRARLVSVRRRRHRRGWVVRRVLLAADLLGLLTAFVVSEIALEDLSNGVDPRILKLFAIFVVTLPLWVVAAKVYGLYDRDEERTDHWTTDDFGGVFHLVTVAVWVLFAGAWLTGVTTPQLGKTVLFWALAIGLIVTFRALGRGLVRHSSAYVQNALVLGAGEVGQLIGRKYLLHPEYGIRLVGLVDDDPRELRGELAGVPVYPTSELAARVRGDEVERVVVAFSDVSSERSLELLRELQRHGVQVDVVPRLYEALPPHMDVHAVEGLPLLGINPAGMSRSSRLLKRGFDLIVSVVLLAVLSPAFLLAAWRIKRDSPGPVFFRQVRLGEGMREFEVLKFRTMVVNNDDAVHRDFVHSISDASAEVSAAGMYKLADDDRVTRSGRWLRKTSLDELPQLVNVLKGEMSLVGPRPCIPYETELFAPQHFERFEVPAGITGLWQVTGRAKTTFAEALDMDVAYARGWSLGLDLRILCRTPLQVLRGRGAA